MSLPGAADDLLLDGARRVRFEFDGLLDGARRGLLDRVRRAIGLEFEFEFEDAGDPVYRCI
jgi:hypothetical protein